MREIVRWTGLLMMLVVICISTARAFIPVEPEDSCCQHEQAASGSTEEKSCANEGNPFTSCSCCVHAWMPVMAISFELSASQPLAVLPPAVQEMVLTVDCSDFWQPPRFS